MFSVNGVEYKSVRDASIKLDKCETTVRQRMKKGWTPEQAFEIDMPPSKEEQHKMNNRSFIVDGVEYYTMKNACDKLNFSYDMIHCRLSKSNWTIDQAFEIDKSKLTKITINGKEYSSIKNACKILHKNEKTIKNRLAKGMTIDQAFDDNITKWYFNSFIVDGVDYKTQMNACKELNIPVTSVASRRSRGWTLDEAYEIIPYLPVNWKKTINRKIGNLTVKQYAYSSNGIDYFECVTDKNIGIIHDRETLNNLWKKMKGK